LIRTQSLKSEVEKWERSAADEVARAERRGAARAFTAMGLPPVKVAAAMADLFPGERFNRKVVLVQIRRARGR
jgi:hypothetical protein